MDNEKGTLIRVYYWAEYFPCGPKSSCCGASGQSDDTIAAYVEQLRSKFPDSRIETIDASVGLDAERHAAVAKLYGSFGEKAFPVFTVDQEVVSMGPADGPDVTRLIEEALGAQDRVAGGA